MLVCDMEGSCYVTALSSVLVLKFVVIIVSSGSRARFVILKAVYTRNLLLSSDLKQV